MAYDDDYDIAEVPGIGTTYKAAVACRNCNHSWEVRIPLGTLVSEYIRNNDIKCNHCQCDDARIVSAYE